MPKSACKWKRTENRTQNAKTGFQKIGSPLERTLKACKSAGCIKNTLEREIGRSSGRPVKIAPTLERRIPRSSGNHVCRKCWELDFSARAALHPLERTSKIWVFQIEFLSFISTFKGSKCMISVQTSHNHVLTWYKHRITTYWSSIS